MTVWRLRRFLTPTAIAGNFWVVALDQSHAQCTVWGLLWRFLMKLPKFGVFSTDSGVLKAICSFRQIVDCIFVCIYPTISHYIPHLFQSLPWISIIIPSYYPILLSHYYYSIYPIVFSSIPWFMPLSVPFLRIIVYVFHSKMGAFNS